MFTGSVSTPRLFYVQLAGEYSGFELMAENAAINVTGNAQLTEQQGKPIHALSNVKITGSKSHDLFVKKTAGRDELNRLYTKYQDDNKEIMQQTSEASQKNDTVLLKQLHASTAYDKLIRDEKAFFDTVDARTNRMILADKNNWWGPFLLMHQLSYLTPEQKEIFDQFSPEAKKSYYGKLASAELYPRSYLGKKAPSLAFAASSRNLWLSAKSPRVKNMYWSTSGRPCVCHAASLYPVLKLSTTK